MGRFIARKVLILLPTLFLASLLVFSIMEILPGDAALVMLGINAQPDTLEALRNELNAHHSFVIKYILWIHNLLQGNLQTSYTYNIPVSQLILERMSVSLPLVFSSMILAIIVSSILGTFLALRFHSSVDTFISYGLYLLISIPSFWLAILLAFVFSVVFHIFPSGGFPGWQNFWYSIISLILPVISLTLPQIAIFTRIVKTSMIQTLQESFIVTARAKGITERNVLWKHAFYHSLVPLLTIIGLQFSFLITGAIIIENVFYLPGIGRLLLQAVYQRDLIVVRNVIVFLIIFLMMINFIVDIAIYFLIPSSRKIP